MSEAKSPQEAEAETLASDDDAAINVVPDPDMEAAMSEALAPVVARAANGAAGREDNDGGVIEVSSSGEAKPVAAAEVGPAEKAAPAASPEPAPKPEPVAEMPAEPEPAAPVAAVAPPAFAPRSNLATPSPMRQPVESVAMTTPSVENRIYDHLVEGDDDVIGLITYSLYEKDRRDWFQHWQRQHGADPTAEPYEAFVEAQLTFAQRDRYRSAARQILDAYASVAVDLEKPVIMREGIAGRVEDAAKRVEGAGRWWRQLPAAIIGGVITALVVVAIVAILVAAGVDIAGYLGFEQAGG